jgi:hypothetical protein
MTSKQELAATSAFGRSRFTPRERSERGGKAGDYRDPAAAFS